MNTTEARADLQRLLAGAQLPALPQSAIRLLQLSQDPDNGPAEFAVPIESDPGLAGQVLRFVNSSYFGFRQEISSVRLAISLVGIRTIKNFALWSAVFSLMPNPRCGPFDLKRLWQDSLRRALFSRAFGRLVNLPDPEDYFAAALLQDMAIPLLAKELPADYVELLEARRGGMYRLSDLERERYGWTHAEAGGILARTWGLPDSFAVLIERHADGNQCEETPAKLSGNATIVLSSCLPSVSDDEWWDRQLFLDEFRRLSGRDEELLTELLPKVDEDFLEFAPVLKLASPTKPLVDYLATEESLLG
jgi:HD-like signal output (HDOD) protein